METETSTVAAALTVKPSVDPKIAIAAAAVLLTAGAAYAIVRYRKAKKAETDSTDENE